MRTRTATIQLRATPNEKARITRHAKRCKLTTTQYLLQLANGYAPRAFPTQAFFELCSELAQTRKLLEQHRTPAAEIGHIMQQLERTLHALEERFLFAPTEASAEGGECHRDDQDMAD